MKNLQPVTNLFSVYKIGNKPLLRIINGRTVYRQAHKWKNSMCNWLQTLKPFFCLLLCLKRLILKRDTIFL